MLRTVSLSNGLSNHLVFVICNFRFIPIQLVPRLPEPTLVTAVPVEPDVPVKRGQPLFQFDRRPYEYKVRQIEAQLAQANQNVQVMKADTEAAAQKVAKLKSELVYAKYQQKLSAGLARQGAGREEDAQRRAANEAAAELALLPSIALTLDGGHLSDGLRSLLRLNPWVRSSWTTAPCSVARCGPTRKEVGPMSSSDESKLGTFSTLSIDIGGVLIVIAIYVLIVMVVVGHLSFTAVAKGSDYALSIAADEFMGRAGYIGIAIAALTATSSAINATFYSTGRLTYIVAKTGQLPKELERSFRGQHFEGTLITAALALVIANFVPLEAIATMHDSSPVARFASCGHWVGPR